MHMYVARKNVRENREITLILKGEMSFATETSLETDRAFYQAGMERGIERHEGLPRRIVEVDRVGVAAGS